MMQFIGLELRGFNLAENAKRFTTRGVANMARSGDFSSSVASDGVNFTQNSPSVAKGEASEQGGAWDFPSVSFEVRERLKDKTAQLNDLADTLLKQALASVGDEK